jgi:ABC-type transport system substrate-binding protein
MKRTLRRAALLAALLLQVPAARAAPEPATTGTVRVAMVAPLTSLDPARAASETERVCISNFYDQLYGYEARTRPYRLVPRLAAALPEISKDGLTQTIRLRSDVRFADDGCFPDTRGRALAATDVVFCLLRMMDAHHPSPGRWMFQHRIVGLDAFARASADVPADPARASYPASQGYPAVSGLEALDAHTLRVHLTRPMPELAWLLASPWTSIYPPEAVRTYGASFGRRPVSSGPYRVVLLDPNRSLLFRRNPTFREERSPTPAPRGSDPSEARKLLPRNDAIEVRVYASPMAAWNDFTNGDADLARIPRDTFTAVVDPARGVLRPALAQRGVGLHRDPRLEIFYDAFNWEDPVVGKPAGEKGRALRYAICLAADDTWAMTRLYTYGCEPVQGPILPEMTSYDPLLRNDAIRREDETEAEALDAAREILADAGYDKAHPPPVLHMHVLSDATSLKVFQQLKEQVARVGIRIQPVAVTWPALQQALRAKKAQMWTSSWYADHPDAQNFLQLFYGPNAPDPNACNYRNPEVDQLYEEARGLPPGEKRDDLFAQIAEIVVHDCVWRYRFRRVVWTATQPWIHGFTWNDVAPKHLRYLATSH